MKTLIKKYRHKTLIVFLMIGTLVSFNSCETTELDLLDDPNNITPVNADVNFILNNVQLTFNAFYRGLNGVGMSYTRVTQQFGEYFFDPSGLNNTWTNAYAGILEDVKVLVPQAEEQGLNVHAGVAQVIQAYTLVTLVDFFGNVPFSEANDTSILNPKLDNGDAIYTEVYALLDKALVNLNNTDAQDITTDLYFSSNSRENWIKLANTLRLKMLLQSRLANPTQSTSGINDLIQLDNFIDTQDFQFNYLGANTPPNDNRNPTYLANYNNGSGSFTSNSYMKFLIDNNDPRLRYYFYRQQITDPSAGDTPCLDLGLDLCYIGGGYFGRDHGDNSFTTSGMFQRNTTWGAYPVGGKFDDDTGGTTSNTLGGLGEGITPIMLSSFVDFMKAEAALVLGTNGNAETFLRDGIRKSITKVLTFGTLNNNSDSGFRPDNTTIDAFIDSRAGAFTSTTDAQEKLDILISEYHVALYGNGVESYNNYRRTGFPSFVQAPQASIPVGTFPRVFQYPENAVNLNNSVNQQAITNQVFWDTNSSNFID